MCWAHVGLAYGQRTQYRGGGYSLDVGVPHHPLVCLIFQCSRLVWRELAGLSLLARLARSARWAWVLRAWWMWVWTVWVRCVPFSALIPALVPPSFAPSFAPSFVPSFSPRSRSRSWPCAVVLRPRLRPHSGPHSGPRSYLCSCAHCLRSCWAHALVAALAPPRSGLVPSSLLIPALVSRSTLSFVPSFGLCVYPTQLSVCFFRLCTHLYYCAVAQLLLNNYL